jgi:hypothetical protein
MTWLHVMTDTSANPVRCIRLSLAFDLIPDVGRKGEHVLFFDLEANYPGRADLETLGYSQRGERGGAGM